MGYVANPEAIDYYLGSCLALASFVAASARSVGVRVHRWRFAVAAAALGSRGDQAAEAGDPW